jgi:ribulose-phosphate 3-epimerase
MTVDPGFGHQHFLSTTLPKIKRVRRMIEQINPEGDVEVGGGNRRRDCSIGSCAGANVLVAETATFDEKEEVAAAMARLRAKVKEFCNQPQPAE